jgi:hypothetical protein
MGPDWFRFGKIAVGRCTRAWTFDCAGRNALGFGRTPRLSLILDEAVLDRCPISNRSTPQHQPITHPARRLAQKS